MSDRKLVLRSVAVERITEARSTALADVATVSVELDAIAGRVLAEDVHAPRDVPPHDYATMDGYAAVADDDPPLAVVGEVAPEDEPPEIDPETAVRIATGAPLPSRADAVLKREDATVADGQLTTWDLATGTNVHCRGTTAEADERLFAAGDRLAPRHAALCRDVGIDTLPVRERFTVGIVATGTEIHEGRQPDRDSEFLANLVRSWGHVPADLRTVPDDPAAVRETIEDVTANHDIVLTTGGTSVGTADHVSSALAEHDPLFAGVRLRPGRPVTAAVVDGIPVVALPGKPIAAHTAAVLVARPLFTGESDLPTVTATPEHHVEIPDVDREYAVPVVVTDGRATALGHVDSSLSLYDERFRPGLVAASTRTTLADGFVLTETALEPDESVEVVPYPVVE
ncbi:molybdopterin molybdotransferase MoeA [Halococcus agarilyticus]|uniref:molybdopterin molybdotransferase MoeA n=1 Tax=Halococcus agarilyticus TaxID=1232219 RepID=UPI000677AC62|nr:molybdopterin molybdotransferase MoeA [Halococcus agarilyticus]